MIKKVWMSTTGWNKIGSGAWSSSGHPSSNSVTVETGTSCDSTLAAGSSYWGGGDDCDEDEDEDEGDHGDGGKDRDRDGVGDAEADRARDGTVSRWAGAGAGAMASGLAPSRSEPVVDFAGLETIDSEAAVTSWVKLAGPLVLVGVGRSCLVDHWSRCW